MLFPARKTVALILSLLFVWLTLPGAAGAQSDQKTPVTKPPFARQLGPFLSAQENLAYSLGVQAYIYGYPLVASAKTMTEMTQQRAPFNQFYYADSLATPAYRDIVTPNSDTLYMSAWLDLSQTPVLLSVPANPQNRYFTVQMLDVYTNTFRNVSNRSTEQQATRYLVVGPHWKGQAPANTSVIAAPANTVWLIGRVEVKGEADLPQAVAFEKQIALTPADATKQPPALAYPSAAKADVWTSLAFFQVMTDMLRSNPPPECDRTLLDQFALIGISADKGFDPQAIGTARLAGLQRALRDAPAIVQNGFPGYARFHNGWGSFSPIGTYGNQFLARAFIAYSGLGANIPEEEAYFRAFTDRTGRQLTGANSYKLHFAKAELPPTSAFWSINVYDAQLFLAETAGKRASVRSNTGTLQYNPDGSLDLYIQREAPKGKESNWLPTPAGDFNLVLRVFAPAPSMLNKQHSWPAVEETKPFQAR